MKSKNTFLALFATVGGFALITSSQAALVSQLGILDLTANGGINPNTGVAWQAGDQYRLAFYTSGVRNAASSDPAVYNAFVTAQAQLSGLGNGSIATYAGWTALVSTTTTDARDNTGTADLTGGAGIGGAGVPVYAMNGTTAIARNNADIWDAWSNPFDGNATIRLASGSTNLNSAGDEVTASQNVYYSPFLNQFGLGDSANVHGVDVYTGSNPNGTGYTITAGDPNDQRAGSVEGVLGSTGTTNTGSSNANNTTRIWNRNQQDNDVAERSFYAISGLLTVQIPEPSTALLGGLGVLLLLRRRR